MILLISVIQPRCYFPQVESLKTLNIWIFWERGRIEAKDFLI